MISRPAGGRAALDRVDHNDRRSDVRHGWLTDLTGVRAAIAAGGGALLLVLLAICVRATVPPTLDTHTRQEVTPSSPLRVAG
ncbi:hypothetical protein [Couchioplanes caeruleus]|uniref:Uncharacterized protein n=2 Tax=Couchioplanes caeruleus TaxID=56438 RepID=A0A1K0FIG4_9ACTN|nr:hypothetical protein [Couchioplanes caeruleus]OJF12639.1 hypothetical protein BG844_19605 [Couchioplanes caeruleus subsp. caeruleus]ROP28427.1 hypothetical protein EDD30_1188 [Couchioplanes caeruleus]